MQSNLTEASCGNVIYFHYCSEVIKNKYTLSRLSHGHVDQVLVHFVWAFCVVAVSFLMCALMTRGVPQ